MLTPDLVARLRDQFPALKRRIDGQPAVYLDGPAGTQVPQRVIDAIGSYLSNHNANHGGVFATSRESDALLDEAHRAGADFVGGQDPDEIAFGANMTTLTFALSRALARVWQPGDEVVVTRLDHDANFTPWALAARDAGATLKVANVRTQDGTLDLEHLRSLLSPRTRMVAVGVASNSSGSINPVRDICQWAHEFGALTFLDNVHAAPHGLTDVAAWDCDFLACSAYKFFGPHVGMLWGRRHLLETLESYKVRPATNQLPGKWMTGTQNHECIAGTLAAIDYLADLGRQTSGAPGESRRVALTAAYQAIGAYETELGRRLLDGLRSFPDIRIWGIDDPARLAERYPTFSITHAKLSPLELATRLAERGFFAWQGNYYAINLSEAWGREPEGMVRLGLVHYNTAEEVDRLLNFLDGLRAK